MAERFSLYPLQILNFYFDISRQEEHCILGKLGGLRRVKIHIAPQGQHLRFIVDQCQNIVLGGPSGVMLVVGKVSKITIFWTHSTCILQSKYKELRFPIINDRQYWKSSIMNRFFYEMLHKIQAKMYGQSVIY